MKTKKLLTGIALLLVHSYASSASNNLHFSGALVTEPCNLDPATSEIVVDFGTVIQKELYLHTRTTGHPFNINLTDCDTSLGKLVTLTFKGVESSKLPGMLAVTGAASGIGIGLEDDSGTQLAVNEPTPQLSLNDGTTSFSFHAYVQGEPEAITKKSIVNGDFNAAATFEINYQ
ncbi:fimbrial protein [Enterobacter mori]|uniref:fimbrial protein n=1 Tax=Enterobacter mori TaxID=539813 RepID=UPI0011DD44CE|nr:fimbrial protein [Enterobacter mori]MBS0865792.1 type 1 fimbrial protein [Enterobacter mori]